MGRTIIALALLLGACAGAVPPPDPAAPESRHAGYYYPAAATREVYEARSQPAVSASRSLRVGFVTGITQQQLQRPYPPAFALFAKGDEAEKLIVVSMGAGGFRGLYQARALLAQFTAVARSSPILRELQVEDQFTFFDFARLLGFDQIAISDGETFAHLVEFR